MKHTCKRLTALVLALAMCFSLLSTTAWAADVETEEEIVAEAVAESAEETGEATEEEGAEAEPAEEPEAEAEPAEEAAEEPAEAEAESAAQETAETEPEEQTEETEPAEDEEDAVVSAQATTYTSGYWSYTISNGEATLTKYSGSSLSISIPSTIGGYPVTGIGASLFYDSKITSLSIPSSIESIGSKAFANCKYLTSVYFNAKDCYAYYFRSSMSSHVFVNAGEFSDSLTVTFGTSVKTIPACLFEADEDNYAHVTKVVIPGNVETIGSWAFDNCFDLNSLTLNDGLVEIGTEAFSNCLGLTTLTIPKTVESIGSAAFYNLKYLTQINFNAVNCDVYYFRSSMSSHVFVNAGKFSDNLTVNFGEGVKTIPTSIFEASSSNYVHVTTVNIPSTVTELGAYAFNNCYDLKTVKILSKNMQFPTSSYDYPFTNCPTDMKFVCYSGSTADTFASENGIKVSYLSLSTPTLSSIANTTSGVKVSWKAVTGAAKYRVFRKTSGGSWAKVGDTTSTSYTDTTAKSGTTYKYTVRCINSAGTSYTSSYNSTGLSIKYLTAGKISSLTNTSSGVTVKWSKVSGASGYYVYRKTSGGSYSRIATVTSGSTVSYSDTAVKSKNGTTYVYAVRPYSGSTLGSYTGKTTVRLTGVSISSLTNSASKKMTVKWGKNSKATGYQIQYSTSSDFSSSKTVTVTSYKTVSKTISSLTKGKKYYVRVRAYKTVSGTKYYSAWSSKKSVKISK